MLGGRLSHRLETLCSFRASLRGIMTELSYCAPPVTDILGAARERARGETAEFFSLCLEEMAGGDTFPAAWNTSCRALKSADSGDIGLISSLAGIIGSSDGESQLGELAMYEKLLDERVAQARENSEKYRRLYTFIGAAAGVTIGILIL